MTDGMKSPGEKMKNTFYGVFTAVAVLVAAISLTYTMTVGSIVPRITMLEKQVTELREGRVESAVKLDVLIKKVDELHTSLIAHMEKR